MRSRLVPSALLAGTAGLALALAAPIAASAHVDLDASSTAPGALSVLTFAIGHGCDGSPTTSVAIDLPAGVQAVTPTVHPGWSLDLVEGDAGTTVTYTAETPLPDAFRDTFEISAVLPFDGEEGDVVAFPAEQTCVDGAYSWSELPEGGEEPEYPAPAVTLTSAPAETAETESGDAAAVPAADAAPAADATARTFGVLGLVVGAVGVVVATIATRRATGARR